MASRHLKSYEEILRRGGCIICGRPASLHHPRFAAGAGQKASGWLQIPLCPDHHQHGGPGVALHADQSLFEKNFGTEENLLAMTIERVFVSFTLGVYR